jgi:hypothetical protein
MELLILSNLDTRVGRSKIDANTDVFSFSFSFDDLGCSGEELESIPVKEIIPHNTRGPVRN